MKKVIILMSIATVITGQINLDYLNPLLLSNNSTTLISSIKSSMGTIELKNHNDTSAVFFELSSAYPKVLNTYKAPVESIVAQIRFYIHEKTGVGELKIYYHNSDTVAIDSISKNFSDLSTGGTANDIIVKDRLWNLEKDESFFISYSVNRTNSSSDATLKYFLDKGSTDTTNTKYWPPRTHIWNTEKNKWSHFASANNFIGSVGLNDGYRPEVYLSIREEGENTPFNLHFIKNQSYDYTVTWSPIKMRAGGSSGSGDLYYKHPRVSPSAQFLVFEGSGTHLTDRWGKNEKKISGKGPYEWSSNSNFIYTFGGGQIKIYDLDGKFIYETKVRRGDVTILFRGGHSLEVLDEDTIFYEFSDKCANV